MVETKATEPQEVQWSELQRDPRSVAALADTGDVRVRRRDGATLLLTREDRVMAAGEGAVAAARALRNVLTHLPAEQAAEALADEFPWLALLPATDLPLFVRDFVRAAQISAELGQWGVLGQTVREWKATAAVYADGALATELTRPLADDHGPVPGPEE
ncbi:hypothetical protein [Asanoa iriomotensis]|uniref:Prevent-host-death family protein n=1 Tax=Asanoa iriomotensis TaxID=234613 RepID=A0ABQ4BWJ5_9ACTN|nr:hypothetical protein [Asanoa iriomotensis]GIF54869.1 hypothetical protein Air01nite_09640 [Asanoa iriomotensis]